MDNKNEQKSDNPIVIRASKLLEVKSLISLTAAAVFAVLAVRGELSSDNVMILLTLVFQAFFSYQTNKGGTQK